MIEKIMVVAPTTAVPIEHRLGRGFEGVAGSVVLLQVVFGDVEVGLESEVFLDLGSHIRDLLDGRQFVDRLGVVGDRAVGVHGDGHGAHAQEAEGDQTKGEHRGREHDVAQALGADDVADPHEDHDREAEVVAAEVTGHETGEDVERRAAFLGGGDDFLDVSRLGGGEDLHQLGDDGAGQSTHADDDGQHPPIVAVSLAHLSATADEEVGHHEGEDDGHDRGQPDQRGQRSLEVHLVGVLVARLGDGRVEDSTSRRWRRSS